jgi:acetylglutamate kinase
LEKGVSQVIICHADDLAQAVQQGAGTVLKK